MTDDDFTVADTFQDLIEANQVDDLVDDPERFERETPLDLDDPETYESDIWYPTTEDILNIHDEVIETGGEPGIRDPAQLEYVIDHIKGGPAGYGPETIPEKAFALIRMLAANHYFIDGNKRTALGTTEVFLNFNGIELRYGNEMREFLKTLARDESAVETDEGIDFLQERMTTNLGDLRISTALMMILRGFADDADWADRKD